MSDVDVAAPKAVSGSDRSASVLGRVRAAVTPKRLLAASLVLAAFGIGYGVGSIRAAHDQPDDIGRVEGLSLEELQPHIEAQLELGVLVNGDAAPPVASRTVTCYVEGGEVFMSDPPQCSVDIPVR